MVVSLLPNPSPQASDNFTRSSYRHMHMESHPWIQERFGESKHFCQLLIVEFSVRHDQRTQGSTGAGTALGRAAGMRAHILDSLLLSVKLDLKHAWVAQRARPHTLLFIRGGRRTNAAWRVFIEGTTGIGKFPLAALQPSPLGLQQVVQTLGILLRFKRRA